MTRVVVTGGAGFLGSHVCEELLRRDVEVVCVDNLDTGSNVISGTTFIRADVARGIDVDGSVDVVFHLACPASPVDYLRKPVDTMRTGGFGTAHALDLAYRKRARFVLASTSEVYGDPLEHPQRETYWGNVNPIGPRSVYDEAKRFAEALTFAYLREHGLDIGVARIFNSYGPRLRPDDGRVVSTFIRQALRDEPITVHGDGSQTRSICYVDDTVRGLLALADSHHTGPFNIGSPLEHTVLELAQLVQRITGTKSQIVHRNPMPDDPQRRCPDITLATRLLRWQPEVSAEEGLKRTIASFSARDAG